MTGRRLYEKYTDALAATARSCYVEGVYTRVYPNHTPSAWPFVGRDARAMWNDLAKRITPRPRKKSSPVVVGVRITGVLDDKVIQGIKGVRAVFGLDLYEAKTILDGARAGGSTVISVGPSWADGLQARTLKEHGVQFEEVLHGD